jgi:hypothetical protein
MRLQFCAVLVASVWPVVAGSYQTPPATLSAALREHLNNERLAIVTSIRGLPLGVRDGLQTLFETPSLDIAEPGAEFQGSGAGRNPRLPARRLIAAGCAIDHCLIYYERGGIGHSWHVALFHWTPHETRLEWGASAPGTFKTIDAVRSAVLSGAIKGGNSSW